MSSKHRERHGDEDMSDTKPPAHTVIQPASIAAWLAEHGHTEHPCQHPHCVTTAAAPNAHFTTGR